MPSETLPAKRLENALGKLQDAQSAQRLAAEELAIVDPWVPPPTGSKRYQRRRAQRWPKGG